MHCSKRCTRAHLNSNIMVLYRLVPEMIFAVCGCDCYSTVYSISSVVNTKHEVVLPVIPEKTRQALCNIMTAMYSIIFTFIIRTKDISSQ